MNEYKPRLIFRGLWYIGSLLFSILQNLQLYNISQISWAPQLIENHKQKQKSELNHAY